MKKNFILLIMILVLVFTFTGCSNDKNSEVVDAIKFKEEYENLNGEENDYNNQEYRSLDIDEDNPFVYKSATEVIEMMENKETFVVYFGFASCPWCRSVIPQLIEVAEDLKIDTIYYVDVKEIRDTLEINEDGEVIKKEKGEDAYYQLLEKMDSVLEDYVLTDEDGNQIDSDEKRIYAPNIISVVDGEAVKLTDGISESQSDGYMELTDEMKADSYDKIKCSIECVIESEEVCSAKTKC